MTYKYYISEHHMGRQVDLLQASIQSQLEGVNKETLLNIWLENCFKKMFWEISVSTALKVAGQVAGESNSSRNISNNLDFSNSLQKYKQISTPIIIIFMIFSPFKRTGKPKINLKSFQWGWTGLAKKCESIQFPSYGSWQNIWGHN